MKQYQLIPSEMTPFIMTDTEFRKAIQEEFNIKAINELVILEFEENQYCPDDHEFEVMVCHGRKFTCKSLILGLP